MSRKLILIVLTLMLAALTQAQGILPEPGTPPDPAINITWPPPVFALSGSVELAGSANAPGMTGYFVEFREVIFDDPDDPTDDDDADTLPWFPVTLVSTVPVENDVLGVWNTRTAPDGLYEIRLVVTFSGRAPVYFVVRPLRIMNTPPEGIDLPGTVDVVMPTLTPTLPPVTTGDDTPRVTAITNANVRSGDDVSYRRVTALLTGQTAQIIGVSSTGSGWYYIELENGWHGWIAPSTVSVSGDVSRLPRIDPPIPPTLTPIPATETPVSQANLTGSPPSIRTATPTCNVEFEVWVNITNNGTGPSFRSVTVILEDVWAATGEVQKRVYTSVPPMNPGDNFVVSGKFNVTTYYEQQHVIRAIIDPDNVQAETNEADNILTTTYTLARGGC